jgi:hypothetical protein
MDTRDDTHTGEFTKHWANRTPDAASASIAGVGDAANRWP